MPEEKDDYWVMKTEFGRQIGWELQSFVFRKGDSMWRMASADGGCRPATYEEAVLWLRLQPNRRA